MDTPTPDRESGRRLPRLFRKDPRNVVSRDVAASRITAFVYGNILVLAALVALDPVDLEGPRGVAYVIGTALSTFVAHVVAESVGFRVRTDIRPALSTVAHGVRDAVPIVSSATVPALLLITTLLGWWDTTTALQLAIAVTVLRLAGLGWVAGRIRRERASMGTFLAGIFLAAVCAAAAVLKWWLTH